MQLTILQRAALAQYREHHAHPPTVGSMLGRSTPRYLLLLIVNIATTAIIILGSNWNTALPWTVSLTSIMLGAGVTELRNARILVKLWQVLDSVMDWQQIDTLLEQPYKPDDTNLDNL